jgi:hypothetical protein
MEQNILRGAGHFDCTYKNIVMGCITIACALLGSHKWYTIIQTVLPPMYYLRESRDRRTCTTPCDRHRSSSSIAGIQFARMSSIASTRSRKRSSLLFCFSNTGVISVHIVSEENGGIPPIDWPTSYIRTISHSCTRSLCICFASTNMMALPRS